MILINKNQEPKEWTEYCSTPGVTYQSIPELVDALLKEQGYICAYCMRRIPTKDKIEGKLTSEDHRIEHIKCRENHEDLQLKYNNMLICCPGHIGEDEHCDRKKGNQERSMSKRLPLTLVSFQKSQSRKLLRWKNFCLRLQ